MSTPSDELKKRLYERVEEAIEQLLEQKAGRRDLSLREMEDLIGDFERAVRQSVLHEIVMDAQETRPGLCERCGGKLRYKGKKPRQIISLRGEVRIERDYYQCETCGSGYFRPG